MIIQSKVLLVHMLFIKHESTDVAVIAGVARSFTPQRVCRYVDISLDLILRGLQTGRSLRQLYYRETCIIVFINRTCQSR